MLISFLSFGQDRFISGTVSDKNELLPFVTVNVKGSQKSVQTDIDGRFSIKATKGDKLVFSFLGYENYEQEIGEKVSFYKIILKSTAVLLEECYGYPLPRQKNSPTTTTISVEELRKPVEENENSKEEPLYIVNGIISTKKIISDLNPDDIESIKIIKGEDSSKIYGQEYKHGIVIISIKKTIKKRNQKINKLLKKTENEIYK